MFASLLLWLWLSVIGASRSKPIRELETSGRQPHHGHPGYAPANQTASSRRPSKFGSTIAVPSNSIGRRIPCDRCGSQLPSGQPQKKSPSCCPLQWHPDHPHFARMKPAKELVSTASDEFVCDGLQPASSAKRRCHVGQRPPRPRRAEPTAPSFFSIDRSRNGLGHPRTFS